MKFTMIRSHAELHEWRLQQLQKNLYVPPVGTALETVSAGSKTSQVRGIDTAAIYKKRAETEAAAAKRRSPPEADGANSFQPSRAGDVYGRRTAAAARMFPDRVDTGE